MTSHLTRLLLAALPAFACTAPALGQDPPPMQVVIPLPDRDFDPTEVAVPWKVLTDAGVQVVFATEQGPDGPPPECDPRLLGHPLLRVLRLTARPANVALYRQMQASPALRAPIRWSEIDPARAAGLLLPGGHWKRGMRQYLEAPALQEKVLQFMQLDKPVAAICHGPLVLARTLDPASGASVLQGRRVTALTARLERSGYVLTKLVLGDYYRTYPQSVEDEVRAALGPTGTFERGPAPKLFYGADSAGHVTVDGNLVTARWPGDARSWAEAFLQLLRARAAESRAAGSLSGAVQGE